MLLSHPLHELTSCLRALCQKGHSVAAWWSRNYLVLSTRLYREALSLDSIIQVYEGYGSLTFQLTRNMSRNCSICHQPPVWEIFVFRQFPM